MFSVWTAFIWITLIFPAENSTIFLKKTRIWEIYGNCFNLSPTEPWRARFFSTIHKFHSERILLIIFPKQISHIIHIGELLGRIRWILLCLCSVSWNSIFSDAILYIWHSYEWKFSILPLPQHPSNLWCFRLYWRYTAESTLKWNLHRSSVLHSSVK